MNSWSSWWDEAGRTPRRRTHTTSRCCSPTWASRRGRCARVTCWPSSPTSAVAGPVSRTLCGSATHIVWFRNLEDLYGAYSSVRTLDMDEELHHTRAGAGAGACVRALAAVERPVGAAVS